MIRRYAYYTTGTDANEHQWHARGSVECELKDTLLRAIIDTNKELYARSFVPPFDVNRIVIIRRRETP